jgi:VIT1/CCC1 family predicted Fe2+/Mn2+ transporter
MQALDRTVRRVRRVLMPWSQRTRARPAEGHRFSEGHRPEGSLLREVVFGANDGFVSNIALVAALAGGTSNADVILLGGVAGLVAGSISMGLGAYVSSKSEREFREAEEARERWEVEHMREQELAETRQIFRLKGITGPLLDEVVEVIARDPDLWVELMMTEELGFSDQPPRPRLSALIMAAAFAIAASFPVAPYIFFEGTTAFVASAAATAFALIGVSAWRASLTSGSVVRKAFEMLALATIAVAVSNGIGRLVGQTIS